MKIFLMDRANTFLFISIFIYNKPRVFFDQIIKFALTNSSLQSNTKSCFINESKVMDSMSYLQRDHGQTD